MADIAEERIEIQSGTGAVIVRPCPAFRVLHSEVQALRGDIDGISQAFDHFREQQDLRHLREGADIEGTMRDLSIKLDRSVEKIMEAVKNRLPLWASAAGAAAGVIIGSLITIVVMLYQH